MQVYVFSTIVSITLNYIPSEQQIKVDIFLFSLINVKCCFHFFTVEYFDAKNNPDNYVCVNVDIKGLKKKFMKSVAANAQIEFTVEER